MSGSSYVCKLKPYKSGGPDNSHPRVLLELKEINLIINNQVVRKIKIAVEKDVKNWAYISLR